MAETNFRTEQPPMVLRTNPVLEMGDERLFDFCRINREWRIERTAEGELEIMPPTGWETSDRNSEINMQLRLWAKRLSEGVASESSGGFILPSGAMRSPDAAWVRRERLANLAAGQKQRFLSLCPDFVSELRSPSDPLSTIQAKMREYVENGAHLGWLIDPEERKVHVYRPGDTVQVLDDPGTLYGGPVLPGFVLDLKPVWKPGF
jgi:Uma2 family endonuclease